MTLRFTEPRKRVFDTLKRSSQPMKAYDIVAALGDVNPMTVYRALDFLSENGLAHRIEPLNAYAACAEHHCEHADSLYLVCSKCSTVTELHDHTLAKALIQAAESKKFTVLQTRATLHGLCKNCA